MKLIGNLQQELPHTGQYLTACSDMSSVTDHKYEDLKHVTQDQGRSAEQKSRDRVGLLHRRIPCWTLLVACVVLAMFACLAAGVAISTSCGSSDQSRQATTVKPRAADNSTEFVIGQSLYTIDKGSNKIWIKAQSFCLEHNSNLAAFETEEEWRAVFPHLSKGDGRMWIGASNSVGDADDLRWVFVNQPIRFDNFYVSRGSYNYTEPTCVALDIWLALKWRAYPCGHVIGKALCERQS